MILISASDLILGRESSKKIFGVCVWFGGGKGIQDLSVRFRSNRERVAERTLIHHEDS